jgi:two-component system chemotaxis response regulator CheY
VDDDFFIRSLIEKSIDGMGKVLQYPDAGALDKEYAQHAPDAIFLDIHMPSRSGLDLLKDILNVDPTAKVIMVTSDSNKENVYTAHAGGAKGFLSKASLTKDSITQAIKRCVD